MHNTNAIPRCITFSALFARPIGVDSNISEDAMQAMSLIEAGAAGIVMKGARYVFCCVRRVREGKPCFGSLAQGVL